MVESTAIIFLVTFSWSFISSSAVKWCDFHDFHRNYTRRMNINQGRYVPESDVADFYYLDYHPGTNALMNIFNNWKFDQIVKKDDSFENKQFNTYWKAYEGQFDTARLFSLGCFGFDEGRRGVSFEAIGEVIHYHTSKTRDSYECVAIIGDGKYDRDYFWLNKDVVYKKHKSKDITTFFAKVALNDPVELPTTNIKNEPLDMKPIADQKLRPVPHTEPAQPAPKAPPRKRGRDGDGRSSSKKTRRDEPPRAEASSSGAVPQPLPPIIPPIHQFPNQAQIVPSMIVSSDSGLPGSLPPQNQRARQQQVTSNPTPGHPNVPGGNGNPPGGKR